MSINHKTILLSERYGSAKFDRLVAGIFIVVKIRKKYSKDKTDANLSACGPVDLSPSSAVVIKICSFRRNIIIIIFIIILHRNRPKTDRGRLVSSAALVFRV